MDRIAQHLQAFRGAGPGAWLRLSGREWRARAGLRPAAMQHLLARGYVQLVPGGALYEIAPAGQALLRGQPPQAALDTRVIRVPVFGCHGGVDVRAPVRLPQAPWEVRATDGLLPRPETAPRHAMPPAARAAGPVTDAQRAIETIRKMRDAWAEGAE